MGDLKPYAATVNGLRTTLMLTESEAAARGLLSESDELDVTDKQHAPAQDKMRSARNK